jgi:hypothetical protein
MAVIEGDLAIVVPNTKTSNFRYLSKNAPVQGPGHICRAGNNCREQVREDQLADGAVGWNTRA